MRGSAGSFKAERKVETAPSRDWEKNGSGIANPAMTYCRDVSACWNLCEEEGGGGRRSEEE